MEIGDSVRFWLKHNSWLGACAQLTTSFLIVVALASTLNCTYCMQVPRTIPKGKTAGGFGLWTTEGMHGSLIIPMPAMWLRRGVLSHVDVGLHCLCTGLKLDGKCSVNDYFAFGGGAGVTMQIYMYPAFWWEISAYFGMPVGRFYPYGVVRYNYWGLDEEKWVTGLLGLRVTLKKNFNCYVEGGLGGPQNDQHDTKILAGGVSFGER